MSTFLNVLFAIPICAIFIVLTYKFVEYRYKDDDFSTKYQNSMTALFLIGVVGIIAAQILFSRNNFMNNLGINLGLTGGGIIIIFYSVVKNWSFIDDITKIIIGVIAFFAIILLSYMYNNNSSPDSFYSKTEKQKNTIKINENYKNDKKYKNKNNK